MLLHTTDDVEAWLLFTSNDTQKEGKNIPKVLNPTPMNNTTVRPFMYAPGKSGMIQKQTEHMTETDSAQEQEARHYDEQKGWRNKSVMS